MHKHHIIPKHQGGTNESSNLIEVTVEEHALIHYNRWQLDGNEYDRIAWLALTKQIGKEEAHRMAQSEAGKKNKGKHPKNKALFKKGQNKGKTYEELYGEEKTKELKEKRKQATLSNKAFKKGHAPNKTSFKKGHAPNKTSFKKGCIPWNKKVL